MDDPPEEHRCNHHARRSGKRSRREGGEPEVLGLAAAGQSPSRATVKGPGWATHRNFKMEPGGGGWEGAKRAEGGSLRAATPRSGVATFEHRAGVHGSGASSGWKETPERGREHLLVELSLSDGHRDIVQL